MSEKLITSLHIQKLGHEIQEIRERALNNILSKLNHGFVFDNQLARSRELLTNLFDWFLYESCTQQEQVLKLIQRTLQSESGRILLNHIGAETIKTDFMQIRPHIDQKYNSYIDDILKILENRSLIVPLLETDVPLSYRSGQSSCRIVESSATPIEGYVQQESSTQPQSGCLSNGIDEDLPRFYLIEPLKWQNLIESDRHVLQSIENNLINPQTPVDLLKSTEFFNNILINDFPAEVFLQRPTIVSVFINLLSNCPSVRLTNSILNCLINLTKSLKIRVNHYNDPCMYNLKDIDIQLTTIHESLLTKDEINNEFGQLEDDNIIKQQQITFPHYCSSIICCICKYLLKYHDNSTKSSPKKSNQEGVSLALILLNELIDLLILTLNKEIWHEQLQQQVLKELNEIFVKFGDILEYYRIETISNDQNYQNRTIHLSLIQNSIKLLKELVPKSISSRILPKIFKNALTNMLIDVILSKFYPETFNIILEYVECFSDGLDSESILKYRETNRICESISVAVDFLKKYPQLNAIDGVNLVEKALPYLDYHQNINFVKYFIELATNKLVLCQYDDDLYEKYERVTLKLLGHNSIKIKKETYKLCHDKIITAIGPKLQSCNVTTVNQILFLLKSSILNEIACFGLTSEDAEIKDYCENILIHLLKCKILVNDNIWTHILHIFKQSLTILLCFIDKNSILGRTLLNFIDPDNIENLQIEKIDIIRYNIVLLFIKDLRIREECYSRLCWLLTLQQNSKDYLPKLNNIYNKTIPNICQIKQIIDLNKNRNTQHFYQPSNLQKIIDLLKSEHTEAVIRRSALTQLSVMMEDPLLHQIFIDDDGIRLLIEIMKNSLIEKNYNDYPDSIISIISILKNLCLFQPIIRNELYLNLDLYYYLIRGLFLFCNEERLKYDGSCLLFLLVYHNFIRGNPSQGNLAIPELIKNKLQLPFNCQIYWKINEKSNDFIDLLLNDKWCLSSLQIQWNLDNYGLKQLLSMEKIVDNKDNLEILQLQPYDLFKLKGSSLDYCLASDLIEIQNSTTHDSVINNINNLIMYINLFNISYNDHQTVDIVHHEWERTFTRFLKILPSSDSDVKLLITIVKLLKFLAPIYKLSEKPFWMAEFLKNPTNHLLDLINLENSMPEDYKSMISQNLLSLITDCVLQEQQFFDYYPIVVKTNDLKQTKSWVCIIELIVDNLKFNDTTYLYNLSYLNSLLSSLVHLTATLGWSNSIKSNQNKIISQLITNLCEMIIVFYYGKGIIATVSMMGLNITRHIILILNHLLAEINYIKMKNWENYFIDLNNNWINSFLMLVTCRDVILRAGSLQLFAGLTQSPRLAIEIVHQLQDENQNIWQTTLEILLDNNEASIVRENCAFLLANLINHTIRNSDGDLQLISRLIPKTHKEGNDIESLFQNLENYKFYKIVILILTALYTNRLIDNETKQINQNTDCLSINSNDILTFITTPSFAKSIIEFLINLQKISNELLVTKLQDYGLIKLIFRCLCDAIVEISDTRKLSVYCEILEMNTSICCLLSQISQNNPTCLGTILYTRDCMSVLLRLLNRNIYYTHLPPLIYLRNRLWTEIFQLLSILLTFESNDCDKNKQLNYESLTIITETIDETGKESFLTTLHESIQSSHFNDLQNASLNCLISLLNVRIAKELPKIQQLFDNTNINTFINNCDDSSKQLEQTNDVYKMNLLNKTLFNKQINGNTIRTNGTAEISISGEQICCILLKLYDLTNLKYTKDYLRKKSLILSSITCLLSISEKSKIYAYNNGFLIKILQQIREIYVKLSLESVDNLKRLIDKKRLSPLLQELNEFICLLTNFMIDDENIKNQLVDYGLSDILHKLWIWFLVQQKDNFVNVLKLLCNFTTNCNQACLSLTLTNQNAGSGPRKTPSNISLLYAIIGLIDKEMEQISKTHKLEILNLSFTILINCCQIIECRLIYTKSNLLNGIGRLHPALTKKQKPWDNVELFWLDFLQNFTLYPEGQSCVAKINDVFDILMILTNSPKILNRLTALLVLRNISFCHSNRTRLLTSDDFLKLLRTKLDNGNKQEQMVVVLIIWTLVANNQRAKIVLKSAQLDLKLQKLLKHYEIVDSTALTNCEFERIRYVYNLIKNGGDNKSR